jgi:hypothetical protein
LSQQINLFNPAFRTQRKRFTTPLLVAGLGLLVIAIGAATVFGHVKVRQLEHSVAAGKAVLARQQAAQAALAADLAPRPRDPGLDAQLARLQAEIAALHQAEQILRSGALGDHAGYAGYFRAIAQQSVPGVWLTGLRIAGAGNDIEVRGRALQAAAIPGYIAQLQDRPAFQGKTFAALAVGPAAAAAGAVQDGPDGPAAPPRFVEFSLRSHAEVAP